MRPPQHHVRQATTTDIRAMHHIRVSVRENVLSNPLLVTEQDYHAMLTEKGRGWVAERNEEMLGFAIVDLREQNIWALFVAPGHEYKGVGRALHDTMLGWAFDYSDKLWLSTDAKSRAAQFYIKAGWKHCGFTNSGEMKFELTAARWKREHPSG